MIFVVRLWRSGEGAYGKVYLGMNSKTGQLMAVKALQLVGRSGSEEVNEQLRELYQVGAAWGLYQVGAAWGLLACAGQLNRTMWVRAGRVNLCRAAPPAAGVTCLAIN